MGNSRPALPGPLHLGDRSHTLVLSVSKNRVRTHVKNIMRKLKVHSRVEAIEAAERLRAGDSAPRHADQSPAAGAQSNLIQAH